MTPRRRGLILLLLGAAAGCGDPAPGATGALSATPSSAAPASAAPSGLSPPVPSHVGSVVPVAPPSRPRAPDPPKPLDPPTFTRLPLSAEKRSDVAGIGYPAGGPRLMFIETGAAHLVDTDKGDGFSLRTGSEIAAWASTRDGASVALLEQTGRVTLWSAGDGTLARTWSMPAPKDFDTSWLALSHDGKRLAVASTDIFVLDTTSGAEVFRTTPEMPPFGLTFTGTELAVGVSNTSTAAWAVDKGVQVGTESFDTGGTFGVAVSPDTRWGAGSAPSGHGLQVADLRSKGSLRQLVASTTCDAHISPWFSADSRFVYANGGSKWIKGFETGTWKPHASYHAPPGRSIAGSAEDLSRVLTTNEEGADARVIVLSNQREVALESPSAGSVSYSMTSDGVRVVGNGEKSVTVWRAADGKIAYVVAR